MNSVLQGQTGSPARLERSVIAYVGGETNSQLRRLYLDCAPIVARHFKLLRHMSFTREDVPVKRSEYNYRLDAAQGIPEDVRDMASLLKVVLTVPSPPHIDLVIALDWQSNPPGDGSHEWPKTEAGELARKKYLDVHRTGAKRTPQQSTQLQHLVLKNGASIQQVEGHHPPHSLNRRIHA